MNYEKYEQVSTNDDLSIFDFISTGKKGNIHKRITFTPTYAPNVFNLAFGDRDHVNGTISDSIVSNNGDRNKILATVAHAVYTHTSMYNSRWIFFRGRDDQRNRLYRIAISKTIDELQLHFDIYALIEGKPYPFNSSLPATAFLIKRNSLTLQNENQKI